MIRLYCRGLYITGPMFWSHIPTRAIVSYTSNLPQNGTGTYSGVHVAAVPCKQDTRGVAVGVVLGAGKNTSMRISKSRSCRTPQSRVLDPKLRLCLLGLAGLLKLNLILRTMHRFSPNFPNQVPHLCCIILCHVKLSCIMLCFVVLCCVMLKEVSAMALSAVESLRVSRFGVTLATVNVTG